MEPITRTTQPSVTGTSVVGIKYKDGILLAADTLGSYGSLAKFRSLQRIRRVGKYTLVAASGEFSDFQYIMELLDNLTMDDAQQQDGKELQPREIHQYLSRVMYQRRSKTDPLWNQILVAGVGDKDTAVFLGQVDLYGSAFQGDTLATGYGSYIAQPLLRKAFRPDMTYEEAKEVLRDAMRVLLYRDARTINKIQYGRVSAEGVEISEPETLDLDAKWRNPLFVNPAMRIQL